MQCQRRDGFTLRWQLAEAVRADAALDQVCRDIEGTLAALPSQACIHAARNRLYRFDHGGRQIVAKRFGHAGLKLLVYSIRRGKAARSFAAAHRLLAAGFATPPPLALIEHWKLGLLRRSYYLCAWQPPGETLRSVLKTQPALAAELAAGLGTLVGRLHHAGLLHRDLTPGNVLVDLAAAGDARFSLVDVNRLRVGPVQRSAALVNLVQLGFFERGADADAALLAAYAAARGMANDAVFERDYRAAVRAHERTWWWKNRLRRWRKAVGLG